MDIPDPVIGIPTGLVAVEFGDRKNPNEIPQLEEQSADFVLMLPAAQRLFDDMQTVDVSPSVEVKVEPL
jgi:hypothetical protein